MTQPEVTLHATCLAVAGKGVLIMGPPGFGKSSFALRLIDQPGYGISNELMMARLVADDQVRILRRGNELMASAPGPLRGKLEIRGLAIVDLESLPEISLSLVVQLQPADKIERLPEGASFDVLGIALPLVEIDPQAASACARLRAALSWLE